MMTMLMTGMKCAKSTIGTNVVRWMTANHLSGQLQDSSHPDREPPQPSSKANCVLGSKQYTDIRLKEHPNDDEPKHCKKTNNIITKNACVCNTLINC